MELGKLLRRSEVEEITGLSTASIYRKMRDGSFPVAIKIGANTVRWSLAELEHWLSTRPRAEGIQPSDARDAA